MFLRFKKRDDRQILHLCTKLTACDSGIDEAFKSMHQSIIISKKQLWL